MVVSDRKGYQWVIDPAGNRWKIVGFNEVLAFLEADGRQINVGRSVLRHGLKAGGWKYAEFEIPRR